ncbi:MAG TPA: hypothetical protein VNT32_11610 [Thermoleophilaceae bacterium]|nr:hypothetical protein [Thermoleophilaceae bacterium]
MWRRFRRRSMAPGRPAVFPEQAGLVLLTVAVIAGGVWFVARVVLG